MDLKLDFPFPVLTAIATATVRPSHSTITATSLELNANAAAIATLLGDGVTGHLFLMLPLVDYFVHTGINFIAPVNPGIAPIHPTPAGTPAEITERVRLHTQAALTYRTYNRVDNALRNQIIACTPEVYIRTMRNPITGYGRITALELLTHLKLTYGRITQNEMTLNLQRMQQPWNPPTPIESLFTQLTDGVVFAVNGGEQLPMSMVIRMAFKHVDYTGLFPDAC